MSVLIKGMGMPECCDKCPLGEYEDSEWFSCSLIDVAYIHMAQCDRLDDCPLIEIPPKHGRLIDADELLAESQKDGAYGYVDSKQICDAPTVIEAEG